MELFALRLGDCCCPYETIVSGLHDGERIHVPVAGYLLKTADNQLALVDTGLSLRHIEAPAPTWRGTPQAGHVEPVMRPEDSIVSRLAQLDISPDDIDYVINTHLHFDHVGNNELMSRATFFVQRSEYEFAANNPEFPNHYWNLPVLHYELLDGSQEILEAVQVVSTPGHSPGHQSVVVRLAHAKRATICGDAICSQDNITYDSWSSQADPATARESAMRLLTIAADDGMMFFGHDRAQAAHMRWAPDGSYR